MKTKIRMVLGGLVLMAACMLLFAGEDATSPATAGHVLILENGRTLEGDIEREGSQYRVRRSIGETWVSADKVVKLCGNLEEAHKYLQKQANLRDPDERMRLAQWCQQHDLDDLALAEISAAVELRPHNNEYRRLLENLQRTSAQRASSKKAAADPRSTNSDLRATAPTDLTANSVSQFITRVQPVLMNTCAGCHGPSHTGPFQLERVMGKEAVNRRATQYNLAHVLAQINPDSIATSPFLTKAVTLHGEAAQPPIKNREAQAFHRLEDWVKQTVESNPQLRERSEPASSTTAEPKKEPKKTEDTSDTSPLTSHHSPVTPSSEFAASQPPAPKSTTPVDPFDPVIFNRQAHPEKQ
jgi:transposase-like protein